MKVPVFWILNGLALFQYTSRAEERTDTASQSHREPYKPMWDSLKNLKTPEWYENAKLGFFIHFGVYSVPSIGNEWFWYYWSIGVPEYSEYVKKNYPDTFVYQDFGPMLKAELFDADELVTMVKGFGFKYIIFTAKHHDGYALWDSKVPNNWNSVDFDPHINFLEKITKAAKAVGLKIIFQYSLFEWFHPLFIEDQKTNFKTRSFVETVANVQLKELVEKFEPDGLWAESGRTPAAYWQADEFLIWLFTNSTIKDTVIVNDRWGQEVTCKIGNFRTCNNHFLPRHKRTYKWENALSVDTKSWGHRRNYEKSDLLTSLDIIHELVKTVAMGGNLALNVGMNRDGIIDMIFVNRLSKLSQWLKINGEAIYNTTGYRLEHNENKTMWYTKSKLEDAVYVFFLEWPVDKVLTLTDVIVRKDDSQHAFLLGYIDPLPLTYNEATTIVILPSRSLVSEFEVHALKLIGFD